MNKTELIAIAAEQTGVAKKDAEKVLNAALDAIASAMASGDRVQLSGFGTFEAKQREARMGRNLRTQEVIEIPATRVPTFKASQVLRDTIAE